MVYVLFDVKNQVISIPLQLTMNLANGNNIMSLGDFLSSCAVLD